MSRNLGTGQPTIQCTAHGEYSHWRRECPYDNFCTTCNNHDHATHMCRAPKDTPQPSPAVCVYCGSMEHSSIQCCNRHIPPEATRDQEFQHTNSKISGKTGFQSTYNLGRASQPHTHRSYVTDRGLSVPARGLWDLGELRLPPKGAVLSLTLLLVQCLQ